MSVLNLTDGASVLPPEARLRELPYVVVKLAMGAHVYRRYQGRKDAIAVEWDGDVTVLHESDFNRAQTLVESLDKQWMGPLQKTATLLSPKTTLELHRKASERLSKELDDRAGLKGLLMLKDASGSGWWRMVHPARYMNPKGWYIDVTAAEIAFEHMIEYDTIFVQRRHSWEEYYVLEKLKQAGKRLVYDIDDDMFHIPDDNPAAKVLRKDQQFAAMACMKLADQVTTTSLTLRDMLEAEGVNLKVIPNALDPTEGWTITEQTGSPDKWKRIFWQGSATHARDWEECIEAVERVMDSRDDVRLVILGYLPPVVEERAAKWQGRVEFMDFSDPETYFELVKHVRAEVGLAPLAREIFNYSKSPIKFIENSLIGMPTVASNIPPYDKVVKDNGFLASTTEEWERAICKCLDRKNLRMEKVRMSRRFVGQYFDIREVAKLWEAVLCPVS